MRFYICLLVAFLFLFQCSTPQTKLTKPEKTRVYITYDQTVSEKNIDSNYSLMKSAIIEGIQFTDQHKFIDEEYEQYFIMHSLEMAQSIGDKELENLLKDMIQLSEENNPNAIHLILKFHNSNSNQNIQMRIIKSNGLHSELSFSTKMDSIAFFKNVQEKVILALEPQNQKAIEYLHTKYDLIKNSDSYSIYLKGKDEKRKKTIHGYMEAFNLYKDGIKKDPLNPLLLNEIFQTINLVSANLRDISKSKEIINKSDILQEADEQNKECILQLQSILQFYNNYRTSHPEEYNEIIETYNKSPYKNDNDLRAKNIRTELEILFLKWENQRFEKMDSSKINLKNLDGGYNTLLASDFFPTITNSRINMNDIIRALIKYSQKHPEDRFYIHYFKNFYQLMNFLNRLDYVKVNPEAGLSYQMLRQEYLEYIRKYISVIKLGLKN